MYLHKPILRDFVVDMSIAYSEKNGRLTLVDDRAPARERQELVRDRGSDEMKLEWP